MWGQMWGQREVFSVGGIAAGLLCALGQRGIRKGAGCRREVFLQARPSKITIGMRRWRTSRQAGLADLLTPTPC